MSKFLKFIVHFVVICTILCVVALAVPPFFGVTTEIRDDSTVKSNLAMGSVTYAIPVKTEEAALGTPILVNDENAVIVIHWPALMSQMVQVLLWIQLFLRDSRLMWQLEATFRKLL